LTESHILLYKNRKSHDFERKINAIKAKRIVEK